MKVRTLRNQANYCLETEIPSSTATSPTFSTTTTTTMPTPTASLRRKKFFLLNRLASFWDHNRTWFSSLHGKSFLAAPPCDIFKDPFSSKKTMTLFVSNQVTQPIFDYDIKYGRLGSGGVLALSPSTVDKFQNFMVVTYDLLGTTPSVGTAAFYDNYRWGCHRILAFSGMFRIRFQLQIISRLCAPPDSYFDRFYFIPIEYSMHASQSIESCRTDRRVRYCDIWNIVEHNLGCLCLFVRRSKW